jgi:hypothetical protein
MLAQQAGQMARIGAPHLYGAFFHAVGAPQRAEQNLFFEQIPPFFHLLSIRVLSARTTLP